MCVGGGGSGLGGWLGGCGWVWVGGWVGIHPSMSTRSLAPRRLLRPLTVGACVCAHVCAHVQVLEMARERGLAVTSVEDVACYRVANFEVPSFFESKGPSAKGERA